MFFRKSKAAVNDNKADRSDVSDPPPFTVIAFGTSINGNIDSDGDVQVEGRVRGHVRAGGLTVTTDGTIDGEATAEEAIIQGHVKGPVRAHHIHLLSGAVVEGNLTCFTVAIDPGARLSGTIRQEKQDQDEAPLFLPDLQRPARGSLMPNANQGGDIRPLAAVRPRTGGR